MGILPRFSFPFLFTACCLLLGFSACGPDRPPPPDVSDIAAPLQLIRFEPDLLALDTSRVEAEIARLKAEYGEFGQIFFQYVLPLDRGDFSPEQRPQVLKSFLADTLVRELNQRAAAAYPDLQPEVEQLQQAVRYLKHYLPRVPAPDTLVTFAAPLEYATFLYGDNNLAVGLDFFLDDFPYKSVDAASPIFSDYLTRTYRRDHLVPKLIQTLVEDLIPEPTGGRLLDFMVVNGKRLYLQQLLLPETPADIRLEMTPDQVDWLAENEFPMYIYLQKEGLLYSTEVRKFRKYIDPSPNSPGMPAEAPGRTANYLGYRIVQSFMANNPAVTVPELLALTDAQELLNRSRFKPKE
ncbi:MAG: hypothetical protein WBA17_11670 [Saprospiraceae bacterium]